MSAADEPPVICRMLRSKTGYGTMEGGDYPWLLLDSSTANSWCLRTMEPSGPDDDLAHSSACRAGRVCFEPPRAAPPE